MKKRMIVVAMGFMPVVMINPEILSKSGEYEAEEGCLSLGGTRKTTRFREIEVKYQDPSSPLRTKSVGVEHCVRDIKESESILHFKWQKQKFSGQIAQIIQHECDHLEGKII